MPSKVAKITTREATKRDNERKVKDKNRKVEIEMNRPRGEVKKMSLYKGLDY